MGIWHEGRIYLIWCVNHLFQFERCWVVNVPRDAFHLSCLFASGALDRSYYWQNDSGHYNELQPYFISTLNLSHSIIVTSSFSQSSSLYFISSSYSYSSFNWMRIRIDELFIFCCSLYHLRLGVAFFPRPLGCEARRAPPEVCSDRMGSEMSKRSDLDFRITKLDKRWKRIGKMIQDITMNCNLISYQL